MSGQAEWMAEAFVMLRNDLAYEYLDHKRSCVRCSATHICGFALGIRAAYLRVEERMAQHPEPFPPPGLALSSNKDVLGFSQEASPTPHRTTQETR